VNINDNTLNLNFDELSEISYRGGAAHVEMGVKSLSFIDPIKK